MKRHQKTVLIVLFLLASLSLGYGQMLVKSSADAELLRVNQDGQVGIGTTVLGGNKLTVAGSEAVNGSLAVSDATTLNTLKITGNSPGAGKILTSNDNLGNAVWSVPRTLSYARVYSTNARGAQPIESDPSSDVDEIKVGFNLEEDVTIPTGAFDLANDWFLVPYTGYYLITSTISIFYTPSGGTNPGCSIYIAKIPHNTSTIKMIAKSSSQTPRALNNQAAVSTVVKLTAGDKVFVMAAKAHDDGFEIWNSGTDMEDRKGTIYVAIKEL